MHIDSEAKLDGQLLWKNIIAYVVTDDNYIVTYLALEEMMQSMQAWKWQTLFILKLSTK
jgi:hypothetical protein